MPLFRRAQWPRDHRDEMVAGALVGAVVIVLGYASGIGATSASGSDQAAVPPAATAPSSPAPAASAPGAGTGEVPVGTGELPGYGGVGAGTGYGTGGLGIGTGDPGTGTGHDGHMTTPPAGGISPTPTPSPSPSGSTPADAGTCGDGEVTLVEPLLTGITDSVFGLLNGTDASPTPTPSSSPSASPCIGLAPVGSLLGGIASPSPSAGATP